MGEARAPRGLLGRTVAGTVGAARRRVEGEVADTARGVIDDLEPYLAEQTVPRLLAALEPHLAERTVPQLVDLLVPHLVESVVPVVLDGLTAHLAERTVPEVLAGATPVLADDVVPELLEKLRPYLETELAPALVDALTPHLLEVTAPTLVQGLVPLVNAEVVPAVLDGVADDPRIRALVREQSWGLLTDALERLRRLLAGGDDAVERVLRRVLLRRRPVVDVVPPELLPAGRGRSHAGLVSRSVGAGVDLVLVSWLGGLALASGFAVVETLLGSVPTWLGVTMTTLASLLLPVYLAVAWRTACASLGSVLAGYSVTGADGGPLGLPRALVRSSVLLPLALVWALGLLLGVADPARRGLLDRLTGSRAPYRVGAAAAAAGAAGAVRPASVLPTPRDPGDPGVGAVAVPGAQPG